METNSKELEELDALRASFPQLLVQTDKVRFALSQIAVKQSVLDISLQEKIDIAVESLSVACANLASLSSNVFDHE